MGKVTLTEESYLRNLPFSAHNRLKSMLEPGREWEKMVVFIPKELDMTQENFEPKYDYNQILNFADRGRKVNGSATEAILRDWDTQNARVKHLIKVLAKAELYAVADYLSKDVLKGDPVPRPINNDVCNNINKTEDKPSNTSPSVQPYTDILPHSIHLPKPSNCRKLHENQKPATSKTDPGKGINLRLKL